MQTSDQQEREQMMALLELDWTDPSWQEIDSLIQEEEYRRAQVARLGLPKDATYGDILTVLNREIRADRCRDVNLPLDTDEATLEAHEAEIDRQSEAADFGLDESADWRAIALARWERLSTDQPAKRVSGKYPSVRKLGLLCLATFVVSYLLLLCLRIWLIGR